RRGKRPFVFVARQPVGVTPGSEDLLGQRFRPATGDVGGAYLAGGVVLFLECGVRLAEANRPAGRRTQAVLTRRHGENAVAADGQRREAALAIAPRAAVGSNLQTERHGPAMEQPMADLS